MKWLTDWELGLGARAASPCACLQNHVSLHVVPALPRKHSLSDSACCCIAPQQISSLKLLLEWGLCWVLPPRWGHTPSLGCWLPSHCPAVLVPGPTVIMPALQGGQTSPRLCQEEAAPCSELALHTPLWIWVHWGASQEPFQW